jgi:chaperonin GroES
MDVKAGDRVVFGKYAGNEVEPNGVKLLLLSENEVMGVYRKKRS